MTDIYDDIDDEEDFDAKDDENEDESESFSPRNTISIPIKCTTCLVTKRVLPDCTDCKNLRAWKLLHTGNDIYVPASLRNKDYIEREEEAARSYGKTYTPKMIKEELDRYVIGQEKMKKALAVGLYNHYKRVQMMDIHKNLRKSNMLLIGPTGSGKTHLMRTATKFLNVPIIEADASLLTDGAWIGLKVTEVFKRFSNMKGSAAASMGIIYFDEIDKIVDKDPRIADSGHDGKGVQHELLKAMEGTEVITNKSEHNPSSLVTHNILFVFSGAFNGLVDIIRKRLQKDNTSLMGFLGTVEASNKDGDVSDDDILAQVIPEDLIAFGFIPEFIGRIPIIETLRSLSKKDLVKILTEPEDALITQYEIMFRLDGIELIFLPEALEEIARIAIEKKIGARGLQSVIEPILHDLMYEVPSIDNLKRLVITKEVILGLKEPEYHFYPAASEDGKESPLTAEEKEAITDELVHKLLDKTDES